MSVRKIIGSRMSDRLSSNISNTPYNSRAYNLCLHWMNSQAILVPFPKLQHNLKKKKNNHKSFDFPNHLNDQELQKRCVRHTNYALHVYVIHICVYEKGEAHDDLLMNT